MTVKIDRKIVKYRGAEARGQGGGREGRELAAAMPQPESKDRHGRTAKVIRMHEKIQRPEVLIGSTYKIKTPVSDHAMYVTINDIVLNEGTGYEQRRPFEIFINSKNLDHFQWIVALTRIISAVFRKGGDVAFLVDELKAVFDPRGGYWQPGGKFMPSIIAELGYVIEKHLQSIGLMRKPSWTCTRRRWWRRSARSSRRAPSSRMPSPSHISRRRAAVQQVQHRRGGHDGRLHDVPELRGFQVRLRLRDCAKERLGTAGRSSWPPMLCPASGQKKPRARPTTQRDGATLCRRL